MKDTKKVYVLTVSKTFMKGHPRAGQPTNFKDKILSGKKIHTIRSGDHWKKVVEEVNAGRAVLSVRQWSGKPYGSKQESELARYEKLGWQDFKSAEILMGADVHIQLHIDGKKVKDGKNGFSMEALAANDGLTIIDFAHWFEWEKGNTFKGGIIHFTDFLYTNSDS